MALFKILKGDSSRIDLVTTPFHDGWVYFTPDDGGLYIDSEDNGEQRRIRINPPNSPGGSGASTAITTSLLASNWVLDKQTLRVDGVTANSNGVLGVAQDITDAAMLAAKNAEMHVCGQGEGVLTVAALGDIPPCDIPVVIIIIN